MSRSRLSVLAAGTVAALAFAPAELVAQSAAAAKDSLAFPRQFVNWVFSSQGDSAYAVAGAQLRESMESPAGVNAMASRIQTRFGERQGTDAEVQFDQDSLKIYIAVMRFSNAPEPGAWVVGYDPKTGIVQRAGFTSLTNVKSRYPQAKLP